MGTRRVVVTGLGLVTPLGTGVQCSWDALLSGTSATTTVAFAGHDDLPSKVGAPVRRGAGDGEFNVHDWVDKKIQNICPPFIEFALAAAEQALDDANWHPRTMSEEAQERTGCSIGSGVAQLDVISDAADAFATRGARRVSPFFVPKILVNMASGHVSMVHALKGPNHCPSTACATGAHALGDAANFIRLGHADVMVAGGTEAAMNALSYAGFSRARALSTSSTPESASRPFDQARDGFVMGEGAGVVVLEELEHAQSRGARIYAELAGYGLTGDAHHITSPPDDGSGAKRAMRSALTMAGLSPSEIGYINAHATSTPLGDAVEARAIGEVFGEHARDVCVSSSKGAIGHLLAAAGAVESIFTILAIHNAQIPPSINVDIPDEGLRFDLVTAARSRAIKAAMSNSFGFGGTNACLVFKQHTPSQQE